MAPGLQDYRANHLKELEQKLYIQQTSENKNQQQNNEEYTEKSHLIK